MNELLLLQIILGIFIWFNSLITIALFREVIGIEPCPFKEWYSKYPAYLIMTIMIFFVWPLGVMKLNK